MTATTVKTRRPQARRSEIQWRELFDRFEDSAQTRERFCREQGIALSSFDRWRTKLREHPPTQPKISANPVFVELSSDTPTPVTPAWDVELQLGAGVILRLRRPC